MQAGRRMASAIVTSAAIAAGSTVASTQSRVESNIVYGMHGGAALLMDVHVPSKPNGLGIVFIAGSGWRAGLDYGAPQLKNSSQVGMYAPPLLEAGYTVFALTHRATPVFKYPAPVDDVQRAVRFIRHNAGRYRIDPARLGGLGGSSGAHLILMLATLDGTGDPADRDPVNHQSSKLQCVVARAAPADLAKMAGSGGAPLVALFVDAVAPDSAAADSPELKLAAAASPITHVTRDDPPVLLIHGDADRIVPFQQSEVMEARLAAAGVPVKLLRIAGADHGPDFPGAKNLPDYKGEIVTWFDTHLRRSGS